MEELPPAKLPIWWLVTPMDVRIEYFPAGGGPHLFFLDAAQSASV